MPDRTSTCQSRLGGHGWRRRLARATRGFAGSLRLVVPLLGGRDSAIHSDASVGSMVKLQRLPALTTPAPCSANQHSDSLAPRSGHSAATRPTDPPTTSRPATSSASRSVAHQCRLNKLDWGAGGLKHRLGRCTVLGR